MLAQLQKSSFPLPKCVKAASIIFPLLVTNIIVMPGSGRE